VSRVSFDQALRAIQQVDGWLSEDQARRLYLSAGELRPPDRIVEIGSFRGRSAIVLALGAPDGVGVTAIDPHAGGDRGPREIEGYAAEATEDNRAFHANLARAGLDEVVEHLRLPSSEALGAVRGPVALLYVDGAHRYHPVREDIASWGERVSAGGVLLVHDAWSAVGVTLALLRLLAFGGRFRYVGRTGSLAEYRREAVPGRARALNAGRQLAELPWFARNLLVKLALVLRLRPLARVLGHRSGDWPY
jgi:predicted O-methyltransferase YrrM